MGLYHLYHIDHFPDMKKPFVPNTCALQVGPDDIDDDTTEECIGADGKKNGLDWKSWAKDIRLWRKHEQELWDAIEQGNTSVVNNLLRDRQYVSINARNPAQGGSTFLHAAVIQGDT